MRRPRTGLPMDSWTETNFYRAIAMLCRAPYWHGNSYVRLRYDSIRYDIEEDDRQRQWGMAKFDPQPTLNPWTDRHQIWNTWLGRGYLLQKTWAQSTRGILPPPHIPKIYTQNLRMLTSLHFLKFFRAPTDKLVEPIFTFNTLFYAVLRKVVPWGRDSENLNLKFNWVIKSQKSKFYNGAYGKLKK